MSTVPTGQSVGVIRYMGRCTHEINGGGEGKAIFQSPGHAAAWMQQEAAMYPRERHPQNVYKCPYFDHYHLTHRQVVAVNGVLVEEGNKASLDAASPKPAPANKDIDTAEVLRLYESIGAAETAKRLGIPINRVYYRLKKAGIGKGPRRKKDVAPVREVLFDFDAINDRKAQLRAEMQKLEEDEKRLVELNRLHVEWRVKDVSITIRKHTDSLTLEVEDCRSLVSQLTDLLPVPDVNAA